MYVLKISSWCKGTTDDPTTQGMTHAAILLPRIESAGIDIYSRISDPYVKEPPLEEEYACQKGSTRSASRHFRVENGRYSR
jgi:hypothetical protein